MNRVQTFDFRLAGMRKPDNFIVYPAQGDPDEFTVQGNRTIVRFRVNEPRGIINWRGSNSKYFIHLHPRLGAELFDVPQEFKARCMEFRPGNGDTMGGGICKVVVRAEVKP